MLRRLLLAALLAAPTAAHAQEKGEIDWNRRVIRARGQGAPDLSAASISVARLGAERAARADAMRNLLETLKGATVENGSQVGTLLQNDKALSVKVQGALRGFRVPAGQPGKANPRYYSDGGVAIEVELPIDTLPEELRSALKAPPGVAAPGQGQAPAAEEARKPIFIVDASGLGAAGKDAKLAEEGGGPLAIQPSEVVQGLADARSRSPRGTPILRAVGVENGTVMLTADDAARLKAAPGASVVLVAQ